MASYLNLNKIVHLMMIWEEIVIEERTLIKENQTKMIKVMIFKTLDLVCPQQMVHLTLHQEMTLTVEKTRTKITGKKERTKEFN